MGIIDKLYWLLNKISIKVYMIILISSVIIFGFCLIYLRYFSKWQDGIKMSKFPKRIQEIMDNEKDYVKESQERIEETKKVADEIESEMMEITKQISKLL